MPSESQPVDEEFVRLVYRHLDGGADPAEREALAAMLRTDPARMAEFVALTRVDGWLHEVSGAVPVPVPVPVPQRGGGRTAATRSRPHLRRPRRIRRPHPVRWFAAAAALVVAILAVTVLGPGRTPVGIARLATSELVLIERDGRNVAGPHLLAGDQLAVGAQATVELLDGSRLVFAPGSRATVATATRVLLSAGAVQVEAAPRRNGDALTIATAVAEARVVGTAFTVKVDSASTRLEVGHGLVRFVRSSDGEALEVPTGSWAEVAPGQPFAVSLVGAPPPSVPRPSGGFVQGVNLNGDAEVISGERWWSHAEAVAQGLRLPAAAMLTTRTVAMTPKVDAATARMLSTVAYLEGAMPISLPLASGRYQVELWLVENRSDGHRAFDITIEGERVATGVQDKDVIGRWHKLSFPVEVRDDLLDLVITPTRGDAHLMGFCVRHR